MRSRLVPHPSGCSRLGAVRRSPPRVPSPKWCRVGAEPEIEIKRYACGSLIGSHDPDGVEYRRAKERTVMRRELVSIAVHGR
jgi:hypothetical protein